jgi:hypothetical protein
MSATAILGAIAAPLLKKYLLPKLVLAVEKIVGSGRGAEVKKPLVLRMAEPIVDALAKQGVGVEQGDELAQLVDQVVGSMNQEGALKGLETQINYVDGDQELFAMAVKLIEKSGVLQR